MRAALPGARLFRFLRIPPARAPREVRAIGRLVPATRPPIRQARRGRSRHPAYWPPPNRRPFGPTLAQFGILSRRSRGSCPALSGALTHWAATRHWRRLSPRLAPFSETRLFGTVRGARRARRFPRAPWLYPPVRVLVARMTGRDFLWPQLPKGTPGRCCRPGTSTATRVLGGAAAFDLQALGRKRPRREHLCRLAVAVLPGGPFDAGRGVVCSPY